MKPLGIFDNRMISQENAKKFLSEEEFECFSRMEDSSKEAQLHRLLEEPIKAVTEVNELYFRSIWASLVNRIHDAEPITLLEIASGDADMIPKALSCSNPESVYITANMNQLLNDSLLEKTKDLDIHMKLIDEDAAKITEYVGEHSVDIIAFQHGVNDVLQGILCGMNGVDTIHCDWMECLPVMIELLQKEIKNNTFEQHVKLPFLNLIRTLMKVLKKEGVLAIHHYMFQLDLDMGYPRDLFENLVPVIREWFRELEECEEVSFEEFDSQWWIFLKHADRS